MTTVGDVCDFLDQLLPQRLAEEWDNVGLLAGDRQRAVGTVMGCLTVTPVTVAEAIQAGAALIVAHHPLPFRPVARLTAASTPGKLLWDLAGQQVAVYSPHTAFDSAATGINQQLAEGLGLADIQPLVPRPNDPDDLGSGRVGRTARPMTLRELAGQLKQFLRLEHLQHVGDLNEPVERIAVACGSAGQFLAPAHEAGCQVLVTGETSFHTCLEARAIGVAVLLAGHYASERFAVDELAGRVAAAFPKLRVWASRREADPIQWY